MNTRGPLVSIVIPLFNVEKYISQAIESALMQTYENIEIIIVDDGSTDKSAEIAKKYISHNVIYIYQSNKGLSAARNTGITKSKGDLIAILDSDDVWEKDKISKQVEIYNQYDITYVDYVFIDDDNNDITHLYPNAVRFNDKTNHRYDMLKGNIILGGGSGAVISKTVIETIGYFNENLKYAEDWEYWGRAVLNGFRFGCVNDKLLKTRKHGLSMQHTASYAYSYFYEELVLKSFMKFELDDNEKARVYETLFYRGRRASTSYTKLLKYGLNKIILVPECYFIAQYLKTLILYLPKRYYYEIKNKINS